jgi:hypothetical protein
VRLEGEGHAVRSGIGGGLAVAVGPMDRSRWKAQLGLAIPRKLDLHARSGDDQHRPEPGRGHIVGTTGKDFSIVL